MPLENKPRAKEKMKSAKTDGSDSNIIVQEALEKLIKLSNSPKGDMSQYGIHIQKIIDAKIVSISAETKQTRPLITEWEDKVFALIARRMINESGSLKVGDKFTLGSATRSADEEFGIGFSAASLIVDLLAKRGIISSISKAELGTSAGANDGADPSGVFKVTAIGIAYAAFFLEKRA
ncbi:MAG: hypothetical protein KGH65_02725 [Candidatus Micrarchaeota archaeon]|nr:hypothetical protein [Candidatus Micrarchaeota archaeon]